MTGSRPPVVLFHSETSDPRWPEAIQRALPEVVVRRALEGVAPQDVPPEDVAAAVVWNPPAGLLAPLVNLKLIQVLGAGVDHVLASPHLPPQVPVARLVDPGLIDRMREYVLLHTLALHRQMPEMARAQRAGRWTYLPPLPPATSCVGILGLGQLGRACAATLSQAGFRVVGWSRSRPDHLPFDTFSGAAERAAFLRQCDILVLLLPLTPETRDLVDARFFEDVRPGAALINVGRGALIDEAALLSALDAGALRHAVLDVFRQEPLPAAHPFWAHPAITITPHNSSATNPDTAVAQVAENIRRALAGRAPLNPVDPNAGY